MSTASVKDPARHGAPTLLAARQIVKAYPGLRALDDVALDLNGGSIHALVGGNGSGKSTLVKLIAGVTTADSGRLTGGGSEIAAAEVTPAWSRAAGVHVVHQQSSLFLDLSVAENLAHGGRFERGRLGNIRWGAQARRARTLLDRFELDVDPHVPVYRLSRSLQTMIEVVRAVQDGDDEGGVLVLDEPTAALPEHEVEVLFSHLRRRRDAGQAVLFVGHQLAEILAIADVVTVLRDGRVHCTRTTDGLSSGALARLIAGDDHQPADGPSPDSITATTQAALEMRGAAVGPVRHADLTVRPGEIVGLAGLLGSGRSELLQAIFGVRPVESGSLRYLGKPWSPRTASAAMRAGIAYVPEDRSLLGLFGDQPVASNLAVASLERYWRRGWMHGGAERRDADADIARLGIKTRSPGTPVGLLSGGNAQKVLLARWFRREPRLLLLDEPTHGIDIGARAEIHRLLRRAAAAGAALLVVSSDFDELVGLVDRVVVLAGGRTVANLPTAGLTGAQVTEAVFLPPAKEIPDEHHHKA